MTSLGRLLTRGHCQVGCLPPRTRAPNRLTRAWAGHCTRAGHRTLARPPLTCAPPACTCSVRPLPVRPLHTRALAHCMPNRLLPAQPFSPRPFTCPTPVWAHLAGARASAIHALAAAYAPAHCTPHAQHACAPFLRACHHPRACTRPPHACVSILLSGTPPPSRVCAGAC
jgi:hypothetical protein